MMEQEGNKMGAAKEKVQMGIDQITAGARRADKTARSFKIFPDNEKVKADVACISTGENLVPARRISAPLNKGSLLTTATDSKVKGPSKFAGKFKVNQDSNAKRKALADVTNASSSFSRNVVSDGFKPMISAGPGSRAVNISSRKCSMGKTNTSQRVGDFQVARKGAKDLSGTSDGHRTNSNNPGCESVVNNIRSARNSLVPMRKSLPVLKAVNKADPSNTKINDEGSEKAKRNSVSSGNAKMSKQVASQVGISRSHLRRNRMSDGFLTRVQTTVNAHGPRKFIKPAVKTANAHNTSRSKYTSAVNKSTSLATVSSKKKEEAVTSSLLDNIPAVVSHEVTQEPPFDCSSNSTKENLDAIVLKKSNRRRSYTSSLMAGSKLLAEHGQGGDKQERVPCIDDNCNQLEVAEYVDEIYQFYWVAETQNLSWESYMSIQTEVTPQMRGILINWLIEVHLKFELMQETLYLLVILLDQYLSQVQIKKSDMQLVGLTALLLASKYEDFWHPRIKDLLSISAEPYTRDQMLVMEKLILKKLKFRLNAPTPYVFMLRFLKAAQSNVKLEHLAFYLTELCLVEYEALKFKPSMLCASAIYVARSTLQIAPVWTPLLAKHARYEVSQIRDCAEMILGFQKAARTSHLKVTYEKYMRPQLSSVAALKPLDKLPI